MKKIYSILLALLMLPVVAFAQDTNKAIKKTVMSSYQSTGSRLLVPCTVLEDLPAAGESRDAKPFTFAAWVKLDAYCTASGTGQKGLIFGYGGSLHLNWNGAINLNVSNGGNLNITGWGAQGTAGDVAGGSVALNEWAYLTMVVDNENLVVSVYKNGELVKDLPMNGATEWFNNEDPYIYFAGRGFGGYLDQAEVYNRALTATEVKTAMYNAPKVSGLTALYTFDEIADGTTGHFVNQANPTDEASQSYWETHNGQNGIDQGGLVNIKNRTEAAPTLTESDREVVAADITLAPMPALEGGYYTISDGTTTWTINEEWGDETLTVAAGTELTFTAFPEEGYNLVGFFTMDGEQISYIEDNKLVAVVDMQMIGVMFTSETYALTVANTENLPYSISYNGTVVDEANYGALLGGGAEYTLSLTVPSTKVLNAVRLNETVLTAENNVYKFTMTEDATLTIDAREKADYTVTFTQTEGGTVGATYAQGTATVVLASGNTVKEGTELTLTATPEAGYQFAGYHVQGGTLNGNKVVVNANVTISATFEEGIEYCVPAAASKATNKGTTTSYSGRGCSSIAVSDGTNSLTITGPGTSGTRNIYNDKTSQILTSEAGKTVTLTVTGSGSWVNTYIYVDFDLNGFTISDQVYRNYTGSSNPYAGTFSFTIPEATPSGTYRVRYINEWENIDPCEYRGGTGDGQGDNGECIIDFLINIPSTDLETPRTVTVASANEQLGSVAITKPATDETSVTTVEKVVTIKATPAEGYSFMNWTLDGEVVAGAGATYNYNGEEDANFVANFGAMLEVNCATGSVVITSEGTSANNFTVYEVGTEITLNITAPEAGKTIVVEVNGQQEVLEGSTYTFELTENTVINITFEDKICTLNMVVIGNGTVECWSACDDADGENKEGVQLANGATINAYLGNSLHFWCAPGQTEEGADEELLSVTYQFADGAAQELDLDGFAYYPENFPGVTYFELAGIEDELTITFNFSQEGNDVQGIGEIGVDGENGPVEYFNLQGVRVAAENLVPGFYIVRQGGKTSKVLIRK